MLVVKWIVAVTLLTIFLVWLSVSFAIYSNQRACEKKAAKVEAYDWDFALEYGCVIKMEEGDKWVPVAV